MSKEYILRVNDEEMDLVFCLIHSEDKLRRVTEQILTIEKNKDKLK